MRVYFLTALVVASTGCILSDLPDITDGSYSCEDDDGCARGWVCGSAGVCVEEGSGGGDGGADGGAGSDAGSVDGGGSDGGSDDGGTGCGNIGDPCTLANATAECTADGCRVTACDLDYDNCDLQDANGCEADLTTPQYCGGCQGACTDVVGQTAACAGGNCIYSCDSDGGLVGAPPHCGGCDTCGATPANAQWSSCDGSTCVSQCNATFQDCGGGCTSLNTIENCGTCGGTCNVGTNQTPVACPDGNPANCDLACIPGRATCVGVPESCAAEWCSWTLDSAGGDGPGDIAMGAGWMWATRPATNDPDFNNGWVQLDLPDSPGSETSVAENGNPFRIDGDLDGAAWIDGNSIWVKASGAANDQAVQIHTIDPSADPPLSDIAVAPGLIYWASFDSNCALHVIARDGSAPESVVFRDSNDNCPIRVVSDGVDVYFTTSQGELRRIAVGASGPGIEVVSRPQPVTSRIWLAVDETWVYFEQVGAGVGYAAKDGSSSAPTFFASASAPVAGMTAVRGRVYWTAQGNTLAGDNSFVYTAVGGFGSSAEALVTIAPGVLVGGIAVDGPRTSPNPTDRLYWTELSGSDYRILYTTAHP